MLIFQFIELEYKCPVYDDSNRFLVPDSSAFIVNEMNKSLIMCYVLLASVAEFTAGGGLTASSEALSLPITARLKVHLNPQFKHFTV